MKRTMQMTMTVILGAAMLMAIPRVHGGEKEWATAGKILTGAAIVSVFGQCLPAPCPPAYSSVHVYKDPYGCPPPAYHKKPGYYGGTHVSFQFGYAPKPYCPPAPVYCPPPAVYGPPQPAYCPPPTAPPCGPIIVYENEYVRLYQTPVHGAPAWRQKWNFELGTWMTVEQLPSIW